MFFPTLLMNFFLLSECYPLMLQITDTGLKKSRLNNNCLKAFVLFLCRIKLLPTLHPIRKRII